MEWQVYIIQTEKGTLYTGITKDLERRFAAHGSKKKGAQFFRTSKPQSIVYREFCVDRSAASKRESAIKKLSREQKFLLIKEQINSSRSFLEAED